MDDFDRAAVAGRRQGLIIAVGVPLFLIAGSYGDADLSTGSWERAIANVKIGETRSSDVRACLHEPRATTTSGSEEAWTYAWQHRGQLYTVKLTFKDSLLTELRRSRVQLPLSPETAATLPPDVVPLVPLPPNPVPPR
jgi:hypothetical protein